MSIFDAIANTLDPPPPAPRPLELATPGAFAASHSRGQWRWAPHLRLLEEACLETIEKGGRLVVSISVRHGKSEFAARWLVAWFLATHPNKRVILACHEVELAGSHGRFARDQLIEFGGEFGVGVSKASASAKRWDLAKPHTGGLLAVGVGGSPIGRGADLMVIDDPIKGYADAMNPEVRRKVQDWYTGTMVSRLAPGAAVILIIARWHEDDLAGFLLRKQPDEWRELRLPALADDPADPLGRAIGEPLWAEQYDAAELERRRVETSLSLGEAVWLAQYQGTPRSPKGGMFPPDRWLHADAVHVDWGVDRWVRAWDLAATEGGGDWTVGARIGRAADGRTVVADVVRGQWGAFEVRAKMREVAAADPAGTAIVFPQDPGQAGKDQAQQLAALFAGFDVTAEPQTGSKEVRATGWAAQQQAGNVVLLAGAWRDDLVAEHAGFPRGTHDDIVDACSSAFNKLTGNVHREATAVAYTSAALRGSR